MRINFQSFLPRIQGIFQESRIITGANHQSSRTGIFLAGDLAGQPLLKTSMQDAIRTMHAIEKYLQKGPFTADYDYDLVICGAGGVGVAAADKCIACGECSRYCQMGIDVMRFALKKEAVNNRNSSCIGCEVCVSVCPMDNLTSSNAFPDGTPVFASDEKTK